MTPAARQSAAIDILDRWIDGQPAEAALTQWARASRFAGSGDREAVRDLVFRAVRQWRSLAALGAGRLGRALILGMARADGQAPQGWTGEGHAPQPLSPEETALLAAPKPALARGEALDCPDWLLPLFDAALGADADPVLTLMRERAPVFVRVNAARADRGAVAAELAEEGIGSIPHPLADSALEIVSNARRLRNAPATTGGRIEMQDAASQAIVQAFLRHVVPGDRVLDYCAGGGGKALALAAHGMQVTAHDIDPRRMRDLPARAARAGVSVRVLDAAPPAGWPAIFADAPCSGSGSWRRAPEAKWRLTAERLAELMTVQADILDRCAALTAPGGVLGYATCSLFKAENEVRTAEFLAAHDGWHEVDRVRLSPLEGGDGFYLSVLRRD